MKKSIHEFTIKSIEGKELSFKDFKGRKILLVNVASACGLTPQYQLLQDLYESYKDRLVVVGCPANNFAGQEPGTNEEILEFCTTRFAVQFPLTEKISVLGEDIHPLYQFVTKKDNNGVADSEVQWNFQKYLFDEDGFLICSFSPRTEPTDEMILSLLETMS